MKKLALAAVAGTIGSAAVAGTPVAPVIEPVVIVEEASSSSSPGLIVPLLLLVLLAAAMATPAP